MASQLSQCSVPRVPPRSCCPLTAIEAHIKPPRGCCPLTARNLRKPSWTPSLIKFQDFWNQQLYPALVDPKHNEVSGFPELTTVSFDFTIFCSGCQQSHSNTTDAAGGREASTSVAHPGPPACLPRPPHLYQDGRKTSFFYLCFLCALLVLICQRWACLLECDFDEVYESVCQVTGIVGDSDLLFSASSHLPLMGLPFGV